MRGAVLCLVGGIVALTIAGCDKQPKENGETLYTNNCARCHGSDGNGGTSVGQETSVSIQGKSEQDIKNAIYGIQQADGTVIKEPVEAMKFLQNLKFSNDQLKAIADYLYALLTTARLSADPTNLQGRLINADTTQAVVITVTDSRGKQVTTQTDETGTYYLSTSGLTPPLLLQAHLGDGRNLASLALGSAGDVTISELTDFVLRNSAAAAADRLATCAAANCDFTIDQARLDRGKQVFAYHFARRLLAAGISTTDFAPFTGSAGDPAYGSLLRDLAADHVAGCSNGKNPAGFVYDDDANRDCFHDNDLDFDGYADDDTDGDGLPG